MDLQDLPHSKQNVNWKKSVGKKVPFTYKEIEGEFEILNFERTKNSTDARIKISYNNKIKEMSLSTFLRGHFVQFLKSNNVASDNNYSLLCKYNVGDLITIYNKNQKPSNYKVLGIRTGNSKYGNYKTSVYTLECQGCGTTLEREQYYIKGCPYCSNRKAFKGVNDITTTDKWMVQFFPNGESEACKYTAGSGHRIKPICPYCGKQSDKQIIIANLKKIGGFRCEYCSDGISFSEKFFLQVLKHLNIHYTYQAYNKDVPFECGKKIYDFYLPDFSCIIETHGSQHYLGFNKKQSAETIQNGDALKKRYALLGGIENYIEINCSNTSLKSLRSNIEASAFYSVCGISGDEIDWNKCYRLAQKSVVIDICNDYELNYYTIGELEAKYELGKHGIHNALRKGNEIGLCNYIPNRIRYAPIDIYFDGKYITSKKSATEVADYLCNEIGIYASKNIINARIRNHEDYKWYSFVRIASPQRKREVILNVS